LIIVCLFDLFLLEIILSVPLGLKASECTFGIIKLLTNYSLGFNNELKKLKLKHVLLALNTIHPVVHPI